MPSRKVSKLKKWDRVISVGDFLEARDRELYTPARIENGEMFRLEGGNWMPEKEFKALYPVPKVVNFGRNKNNPDGYYIPLPTRDFHKF